jgi:hypothetical protein
MNVLLWISSVDLDQGSEHADTRAVMRGENVARAKGESRAVNLRELFTCVPHQLTGARQGARHAVDNCVRRRAE